MKIRKLKNWIDGLSEKELDKCEFEICNVKDITEQTRIKGMIKQKSLNRDMEIIESYCLLVNPIIKEITPIKHHYRIKIKEETRRKLLWTKRVYHIHVDRDNFISVDNFNKAQLVKERLEELLNE